jgi:16S rRNA (cytosine967-C5)-methyltransferase
MIAPARRAALDALAQIEEGQIDMGAAVARARATLHDERDQALLLELVSGTLRMRSAIDYQLSLRVKRPLAKLDAAILNILRMSAFQLMYLTRLPASAVINDAVDMTRRAGKSSASGLANAVLRAISRERDQLKWPAADDPNHLSVVHSHPRWLIDRWLTRYGLEDTTAWLVFDNQPAALCLAANRHLTTREALAEELLSDGVTTNPTSRAANGLEVTNGRALSTRAFREGRCIVQDEASQLIGELALSVARGRVLDLCASPGGKTLALSIAKGTRVIASDIRANRVRLLATTLKRCRVPNVSVVHVADGPLPFPAETFDLILIDAPCSGLGTVRRDPDIRWRRSAEDLARFAAAQRDLLMASADLVKHGGSLVYSTCSSEPEENDDVVATFLQASIPRQSRGLLRCDPRTLVERPPERPSERPPERSSERPSERLVERPSERSLYNCSIVHAHWEPCLELRQGAVARRRAGRHFLHLRGHCDARRRSRAPGHGA